MSNTKPLVLIASVTGRTGGVITQSLLGSEDFRLAAIVRPASLAKPAVKDFQSKGVEIREGDISDPELSKLDQLVKGVDILILSVLAMVDQKPILLAAKRAGVKRVVPSEFGPPTPRGVSDMIEIKLNVRDFIKAQGLPYTFIEIGWWTHQLLPYPRSLEPNFIEALQNRFNGDGKARILCTDYEAIGEFVKRIIADTRTLNQTVITWDYEIIFGEIWKEAERVSGESFADYPRVSIEEIKAGSESKDPILQVMSQYTNSLYVRQDCTLENAKALGALDARELYPDYTPVSLEESVKAFYKSPFRVDLGVIDLSSFGDYAVGQK